MGSTNTFTLVGKFQDDISGPISAARASVASISGAAQSSFASAAKSVADLSIKLQDNIVKLQAEKALLQDPVYRKRAQEAEQLKREIDGLTGSLGEQKTGWANIAGGYYVVAQAMGMVSAGVMSIVDAAKQYDSIRSRLNAAEGSSILGAQDFREIQEMAKKPGLGFEQAATTMATLRGMKVTAGEAKQLILGIAQANASAAGTAEQFGAVMYQIQQSVSLGRLMSEDLKPIMQQIPTLGAAIQEHFGASQAEELNKRLKESGTSVRDFWLEVANLGQQLPATGETIANNIDNMGDAWVRFRAALSDNAVIKGATRAMAGLLDKISEFLEKDQDVERAYIIRTKVIKAVQEQESKAPASAVPKFVIDEKSQAAIMANILKAGAKKGTAEVKTGIKTLYQTAIDEYNAGADRLRAENEAQDKKDRDKNTGGADAKSKRNPAAQWAIRTGPNEVTLTDSWRQMDSAAAEHVRNVERAEATDKRKGEERLRERERLVREIERKEKEIIIQEGRVEKAKKRIAEAIAKDEERRQKERLDNERRFWEQMKQSTTDGLAGILIAEQEGASWWSGIDGMRHRLVKAGITGATRIGVDWLAGMAGMAAGGPVGGALGMGGMEMLSSFLGFRANGGHTLNAQVVGEHGREVFRPATPGTIYNNSQSTNFTGGITVILPNARSADDIARDLPRATRSAAANRRQTSR